MYDDSPPTTASPTQGTGGKATSRNHCASPSRHSLHLPLSNFGVFRGREVRCLSLPFTPSREERVLHAVATHLRINLQEARSGFGFFDRQAIRGKDVFMKTLNVSDTRSNYNPVYLGNTVQRSHETRVRSSLSINPSPLTSYYSEPRLSWRAQKEPCPPNVY